MFALRWFVLLSETTMDHFDTRRLQMVERQIEARGIRDPAVLAALRRVPRHAFVPDHLVDDAYIDAPLPIGMAQTISQPYIVALTVDALHLAPHHRVLEIGTGTGYSAAVLSLLAQEVHTVERIPTLADQAAKRLRALGFLNVHVHVADGTLGFPKAAPYDGIAVTASGPKIPDTLLAQLAVGGRMIIPVGPDEGMQELLCISRIDHRSTKTISLGGVRFVPLVGAEGWGGDGFVG